MDDGCKWQKSRIGLDESRIDFAFVLTLYDDGPGLEPSLRRGCSKRGRCAGVADDGETQIIFSLRPNREL